MLLLPGGMAERPIAPVLKTGNTKVFEGSNPSPSAPVFLRKIRVFNWFFAFRDFKAPWCFQSIRVFRSLLGSLRKRQAKRQDIFTAIDGLRVIRPGRAESLHFMLQRCDGQERRQLLDSA